uniref:ZP domain-containing protein n=1 Tax=Ciona intestinalis TaxID=7719 RepID=F6W573_CIOIN
MMTFVRLACVILTCVASVYGQMVIVGGKDMNVTTETMKREFLSPGTVKVDCTPTVMCVSVSKQWLADTWQVHDPLDLSLNLRCDQSAGHNLTHVTLCTANQQLSTCGTEFEVNDTYVIYSNNITVRREMNVTSQVRRSFPWRCVYPVRILVGVKYIPIMSQVTHFLGKKTAKGEFRAGMFMFTNSRYTTIYQTPPSLNMDDKIRVRVKLIQGPSFTKMQLYRCWGTPSPLSSQPQQEYELINNFCPSPMSQEANVTIVSNGDLAHATWESSVFRFVNSTKLYLHCNVKLCFSGAPCVKTCTGNTLNRKRRDLGLDNAVVSLGPINPSREVPIVMQQPPVYDVIMDDVTQQTMIVNRQRENFLLGMPRTAVYITIGILVFISIVLAIVATICIVRRKRNSKRVVITSRKKHCDITRARSIAMSSNFEIPITVR